MAEKRNILRRLFAPTTKKDPEEVKLKPKGYSARVNDRVEKYFATVPRNANELTKNWNIYATTEVPFAAITSLSYNIANNWKIRSDDDALREQVEKFCYDTDFHSVLVESVRDCLVFGDAFVEKVYDKSGVLAELRVRDPRTFQKKIDEKGDVISYYQTFGENEPIELKPNEVVHYQLFTKPDSPYGLALIDPSKDTILRKTISDEGIAAAMDRHGYPKYHIVLKAPPGFETELPSSTEIDNIASDFKNINAKNEIVTTELIEIRPLDVKGIENIQDYFNYFQSSLTCGMLVPQEVLGLGSGSTEATAKVRRLMFEKMVKGFQNKIARTSELCIFKEFVEGDQKVPRLIFEDVVPEDDDITSQVLMRVMPPMDPFAVLTRDEIREKLGYPPIELAQASQDNLVNSMMGKTDEKVITKTENISDLSRLLKEYEDKMREALRSKMKSV